MITNEIVLEGLELIKYSLTRFVGTKIYFAIYIVAFVFGILFCKTKNNRAFISRYSIIAVLIIFNPVFAVYLDKLMPHTDIHSSVYWRMFWILPLGVSVAYMFTELIFLKKNIFYRILLCAMSISVIVISGRYMYSPALFGKTNNLYKVPDEYLGLYNKLDELRGERESIKVFFDYGMTPKARQINAHIEIAYGRLFGYHQPICGKIVCGDLNGAVRAMRDEKDDYLVWETIIPFDCIEGVEPVHKSEKYTIYRILTIEEVARTRIEKGESLKGLNIPEDLKEKLVNEFPKAKF